jgi:hypothetical protein
MNQTRPDGSMTLSLTWATPGVTDAARRMRTKLTTRMPNKNASQSGASAAQGCMRLAHFCPEHQKGSILPLPINPQNDIAINARTYLSRQFPCLHRALVSFLMNRQTRIYRLLLRTVCHIRSQHISAGVSTVTSLLSANLRSESLLRPLLRTRRCGWHSGLLAGWSLFL